MKAPALKLLPFASKTHPAIDSATRAIQRATRKLAPGDVFRLAVIAETMAYGKDVGRWSLSVAWGDEKGQGTR